MGPALFILLDFGAALRVYRLQMAILAESETGLASGFSRLLPAFPGFSFRRRRVGVRVRVGERMLGISISTEACIISLAAPM